MFTLQIEVYSCKKCPKLSTGRTFGNDGRDGVLVYKCLEGAFGGVDDWGYSTGLSKAPNSIHENCPYMKKKSNNNLKLVIRQLINRGFSVRKHDDYGYMVSKSGRNMYVSEKDLSNDVDVIKYLEKSL